MNTYDDPFAAGNALDAERAQRRHERNDAILSGMAAGATYWWLSQPRYVSPKKAARIAEKSRQERLARQAKEDAGMKAAAARIKREMIAAGTWPRPEDY